MTTQEIEDITFGLMLDLISCLSIYEGNAVPKKDKVTGFDEAIRMR